MARPKPLTNPKPLGAVAAVLGPDGKVAGYRRLDRSYPLPVMPFLAAAKGIANQTT